MDKLNSMLCLNAKFSTTRIVTKEKPIIDNKPEDKFETALFLPPVEGRKGEGGLRTQGYFKTSLPDKPLITVITVVFNGAEHLEETILSVINQTYDNVEYIIIDGGSTDKTSDIIRKYEGAIDYWVSEPDKGIYGAMNKGITLKTGLYILFLGADDQLNGTKVLFDVFTGITKINPLALFGSIAYKDNEIIDSKLNLTTLLHNTVHHQSCFYHQSLFKNWRYDSSLKLIADYELNLIIFKNKLSFHSIKLIISLCSKDGASNNKINFRLFKKETNLIRKRLVNNDLANYLLTAIFELKTIYFNLKRILKTH
jgi:glycosyltransferase involved in cell wall biosynthesis